MKRSTQVLGVAAIALAACTALIWYAVMRVDHQGLLRVSFLDVGEGDAILIESPNGARVLIDGGPDDSVLRQLGTELLPWDRRIDAVIATHPDKDHSAGLISVLERYDVPLVMQSSVEGSTPEWRAFEQEIADRSMKKVIAQRGQVMRMGDVSLTVLSPDRPLPHADTNTACVVTRLTYRDTAFVFSCDAPQAVEKYLAALDGASLHADVLKVGHHGSKTSSSPYFVGAVAPAYVVYSRGCDNSYGFPNTETVATYARFGVTALDTCTDGTIHFVSDGVVARQIGRAHV